MLAPCEWPAQQAYFFSTLETKADGARAFVVVGAALQAFVVEPPVSLAVADRQGV